LTCVSWLTGPYSPAEAQNMSSLVQVNAEAKDIEFGNSSRSKMQAGALLQAY